MSFASTWNNFFKHWISSEFLLIEGYVQGAVGKELHMVPFVERFKKLLWESLTNKFLPVMRGYLQGALRKELLIDPILKPFKTTALGKSY